jgi:RNA polymerase sigma-70 factor (ECF subfamily)
MQRFEARRPLKDRLDGMKDDRTLVELFLRTRSDDAFSALYRAYAPVMYRLIVRLLGRAGADTEDALQDAWIRAAGQLERFRWESSLRTWLCGIAVNCCRERLRRGLPFTGPEFQAESLAAPVRPWQSIDLERAIARLPSGGRVVFVLHDIHGYTHDEIGRLLDIESSSSRSQLVRARRALRAMLAPAFAPNM